MLLTDANMNGLANDQYTQMNPDWVWLDQGTVKGTFQAVIIISNFYEWKHFLTYLCQVYDDSKVH